MMQDRLPNGASVSRLWSDDKTELLAIFQYKNDAELFVERRLEEDARHNLSPSRYLIACSYSGKVDVVSRNAPSEKMPA